MTDDFLSVEVEVSDGSNLLRGAIAQRLGELPDHKLELMEAVGRAIREHGLTAQWHTEGGFFGDTWADTEPNYTSWKVEMFGQESAYIGVRTGALREAATSAPGAGAATRSFTGKRGGQYEVTATPILEATEDSVTVGVDAEQNGFPYARQFDEFRRIFGTDLPYELEVDIGRALWTMYASVARAGGAKADLQSTAIDRYMSNNAGFFGG